MAHGESSRITHTGWRFSFGSWREVGTCMQCHKIHMNANENAKCEGTTSDNQLGVIISRTHTTWACECEAIGKKLSSSQSIIRLKVGINTQKLAGVCSALQGKTHIRIYYLEYKSVKTTISRVGKETNLKLPSRLQFIPIVVRIHIHWLRLSINSMKYLQHIINANAIILLH